MIQDVDLGDAEGVCRIYNHYVGYWQLLL